MKKSFQLINGSFSKEDAVQIIDALVKAKIKYHEEKIDADATEETINMRETRIIELQKEWRSVREELVAGDDFVALHAAINF